jgi:hypothetical protein
MQTDCSLIATVIAASQFVFELFATLLESLLRFPQLSNTYRQSQEPSILA